MALSSSGVHRLRTSDVNIQEHNGVTINHFLVIKDTIIGGESGEILKEHRDGEAVERS